jgi:hypothetical protein
MAKNFAVMHRLQWVQGHKLFLTKVNNYIDFICVPQNMDCSGQKKVALSL